MTSGKALFRDDIEKHMNLVRAFAERCGDVLVDMADKVAGVFRDGGWLFIFGNGGSAADAQHIAAEFVNKMTRERRPLPAIALTTDSSVLTSISNDMSFEDIFSRQLAAQGSVGDIALGITTSGNSPNILKGVEKAAALGMTTFTFLGGDGGELKGRADYEILIPRKDTPRIQEVHILAGHILCRLVEEKFV